MSPKRKKQSSQVELQEFSEEHFLRSINLVYDAEEPERIAHFRPTTKSVTLLNALLGTLTERAYFVVAPYGSGKSLTATYGLHVIENNSSSKEILQKLGEKVTHVSPELGEFVCDRQRSKTKKGITLALHGHCPDLAQNIRTAIKSSLKRLNLGRQTKGFASRSCTDMQQAIALLNSLQKKCESLGLDRISIIWDEFGRHVEALIEEGKTASLHEIQMLAEFASRSKKVPITLALLLHQGLLNYAGNMPQSVRAEWTKIEGRFHTIQFVDDSKEIYSLIGDVARTKSTTEITKATAKQFAIAAKKNGMFSDFTQKSLTDLLFDAYPLDPTTFYLLPRVAARVAQNERTLFSFLYSVEWNAPIKTAVLYDYFSSVMRSDTAVGGTHRQWLETESAISKVSDNTVHVEILKTACLLGLGTSGERSRSQLSQLLFALKCSDDSHDWKKSVAELIDRKLLLHRKHNDEVSIWHGTDADLRGRLEEEKRKHRESFELLPFLSKEFPPSAWKPVEYNDDFCIRRYLAGEYQSVGRLDAYINLQLILESIPIDCDGKVLYVVANDSKELAKAEEVAKEQLPHEQVIVALPEKPIPLFDAALEVWCLAQMELDSELVGSDPLILPEIQQMTDDARLHLQRLIDQLVSPTSSGPRWFYRGKELEARSPRELRHRLSEIMKEVFPKTPKINNEMIVRKKPSNVLVNSRKKLLMSMLERNGQEDLGIQGNFPDMSMFRTVLLHTGLYRKDSKTQSWGYASPRAIKDKGLKAVWGEIQKFLTVPSDQPKDIKAFLWNLMGPPFGVRAGVIPILLTAGLKAFPSAISLTKDGEYVTDVLPTIVEDVCRNPSDYKLLVLDIDDQKTSYLRSLHKCFASVRSYHVPDNDLIRQCFDAIESWKSQLPPAAFTTRNLADRTRNLRDLLLRNSDPVHLLLKEIPKACNSSIPKKNTLIKNLKSCIAELEGVAEIYVNQAGESLRRSIQLSNSDTLGLREVVTQWADCFSDHFTENITQGVAKGLLARMKMPYQTDEQLLESLASLLVGKAISRWDDSSTAIFERQLNHTVNSIEENAITTGENIEEGDVAADGLATLVESRLSELVDRLIDLVGEEKAESKVQQLLLEHTQGSKK